MALQESLEDLSAMFNAPSTQIQQILIRRCTDPLKLIRSVASQLRTVPMSSTQKEPEPSHFVGSILKPLKEYFAKGGSGDGLHAEVGEEWSRRILAEVISRSVSFRHLPRMPDLTVCQYIQLYIDFNISQKDRRTVEAASKRQEDRILFVRLFHSQYGANC